MTKNFFLFCQYIHHWIIEKVHMCYNTPMLIDDVTISIKAGDGGNGSVHFKRNAQTAKGGPDGGNGGNGGNIYFVGVDDIGALRDFRFRKKLDAEAGIGGGRQNLYGRNGNNRSEE